MRSAVICLLVGGALLQTAHARSEATEITVRVIARNAQYVGDLVEGAFVTITDAETGELLAQGTTQGDPGNPKRTMATRRARGEPMAAPGDAKFSATLNISEPRYVRVSAYGPLDRRYAANRASATQWVVPGKHMSAGDGWVLELPGLLVAPNLHADSVSLSEAAEGIAIQAEVLLMCGCPIKPGFYWDTADYEVVAVIRRGHAEIERLPLSYAGAASEFEATFSPPLPGVYEISVYAYDSNSGNTGVGRIALSVTAD